MTGHVFISYSRSERDYVEQLAQYLTERSITVWYDYEVETGEPFSQRIQTAIDESVAFIVVVTAAAVESSWVRRELSRAVRKGIPLCPLMRQACDIPIELDGVQSEDVTDGRMPTPRFVARLGDLVLAAGYAAAASDNEVSAGLFNDVPTGSLRDQVKAVIAAMVNMTPDKLSFDRDGDISIRSGSAMVFVGSGIIRLSLTYSRQYLVRSTPARPFSCSCQR
jgi:TIR domain